MQTNCSTDNEPVFIGKIIEEEMRRQERTVAWLSRKINCARRNIYNIFSRKYIDTELLYRLSVALRTDFFKYYSAALQFDDSSADSPELPKAKVVKQPAIHRPSDCR